MIADQKLARVHVSQRPKGIVRPVEEVRFFDSAELLMSAIASIGVGDAVCCFNTKAVESVEIFTGEYNPTYRGGKRSEY